MATWPWMFFWTLFCAWRCWPLPCCLMLSCWQHCLAHSLLLPIAIQHRIIWYPLWSGFFPCGCHHDTPLGSQWCGKKCTLSKQEINGPWYYGRSIIFQAGSSIFLIAADGPGGENYIFCNCRQFWNRVHIIPDHWIFLSIVDILKQHFDGNFSIIRSFFTLILILKFVELVWTWFVCIFSNILMVDLTYAVTGSDTLCIIEN